MLSVATIVKIHREKDPSLKTLLQQEALQARDLYAGALDNWWGPKTDSAYERFLVQQKNPVHQVVASTFADPADVRRFRACIAQGKTEQECFKVGDNGIGVWGADTTSETVPMCALPPEDVIEYWGTFGAGEEKLVTVTYEGRRVDCILNDRMPYRQNITNGAGIDLNPGACRLLGIPKGGMVPVTWEWAL